LLKKTKNDKIRNIAIIAHVDHGKTTLVDAMLKQSGLFRENQNVEERILDSMDLEREHGITIAAKNCSIKYKDVKINVVDTPGHADFGGEVERAISMVDGAILLVDAAEGPLPQTRFVLKKALERKLKIIVVINKIDRKDARSDEVLDEIYDLFIDLDANEEQLDFTYLYSIAKEGIAKKNLDEQSDSLEPMFSSIISEIPPPSYDKSKPFQMLVSDLGHSDYLGKLAIGKIANGSAKSTDNLIYIDKNSKEVPFKISKMQVYEGLKLKDTKEAEAGDILVISGTIDNIKIGDTICSKEAPLAMKRLRVDEPTVAMKFTINTSPFAGLEGDIVQANKIKDRLHKETIKNVSIALEETDNPDEIIVKGRGELQLVILIEMMRREGFELTVGRPQVIFKYEGSSKMEPIERLFIDCNEEFVGAVTNKLSQRKGKMVNMINKGSGRVRLEFIIPARTLIGYRDEFMTDTRGTGIMNSYFEGYNTYMGDFKSRFTGSLVSDREGLAMAYALFNLEPRGRLFIKPQDRVYEGMIVGEHSKDKDLNVNPTKEKKLSNMRAAGRDDNIILAPVMPMSLEKAINFIKDDELVEVTPKSVRLRKAILSAQKRKAFEHGKDV
jgi:GTP-binding protein